MSETNLCNLILGKIWDPISETNKNHTVFLALKVGSDDRVKLSIVRFAWLELTRAYTSILCLTPTFRLTATGQSLRLFEVSGRDLASQKCIIDVVLGIAADSICCNSTLHFRVGESQHDVNLYQNSRELYNVVPIWNDTMIPVINEAFKIRFDQGIPDDLIFICGVFNPWVKHSLKMARTMLLPDSTIIELDSYSFAQRMITLPDIESFQRLAGSKKRTMKRTRMFDRELIETVFHPDRVARADVFVDDL